MNRLFCAIRTIVAKNRPTSSQRIINTVAVVCFLASFAAELPAQDSRRY